MTANLDRMLAQLRDRQSAQMDLGDVEQLAWQRIGTAEYRRRRTVRTSLQAAAVTVAFVWGVWMGGHVADSPEPPSSVFLVEQADFLLARPSHMYLSF